ncbi:MAG TPA: 6,7-dimethyl-8-ribityllumazine synthase [Thermoanaerobaculia bacterium]|nr:6,7-dimethyl-8-ribityllumazine synthase [Thermoanaerobaculia bacterium]
MPPIFEGDLHGTGLRFAVVASRFNEDIVTLLLEGAVECLARHGTAEHDIEIYRVPGAFEIPAVAAKLAATGRFAAIVTIGCLIRGETPHFDFISSQTTDHISLASMTSGVPISFGVITCDTMEQARDRCRKGNNKGWEAALAAIELANLARRIAAPEGETR